MNGCTDLTDLSPLADSKSFKTLSLPPNAKDIEFLRAFTKLERLSFAEDSKNGYRPAQTAAEFWKEYDSQGWVRALRATGLAIKSAKQLEDGTWALNFEELPTRDLTPCAARRSAL